MSVHIAKGKLFRVTVSINDDVLALMNRWPEMTDQALNEAAVYWHEGVLPKHFNHGAAGKYNYVQRTVKYMRQAGKGGKPYLYFTGGMARDLKSRSAITLRKNVIELRMWARTLNLVPRMAQDDDAPRVLRNKKGKQRNFPNLIREVKVVLDDEREALAAIVTGHFEKRFGEAQGKESDD